MQLARDVTCCNWGVAFYPERGMLRCGCQDLLVATAVCGIMAVNWMSRDFQTEGIRKGVSGGWIMAGGVICYVVCW